MSSNLLDRSVTTKHGRIVTARLLASGDAPLLVDLFARLSEHSRWLRFSKPHAGTDTVWREAMRVANGDPQAGVALIGVVQEENQERAVAIAQLARIPRNTSIAEVAVVVRDDYQGEGLGKELCRMLTEIASQRGIKTLQAFTQVENRVLQRLVRSLELPYTSDVSQGEMTLCIQLPGR